MRLFGYYAVHSFVNQLRKLLKTWVILFVVVCAVVGGIIGYTAATIEDASEEYHAEQQIDEDEEFGDDADDPDGLLEEWEESEEVEETIPTFLGVSFEDGSVILTYHDGSVEQVSVGQLLELIAMAIILIVLIYEILSADKNGSKIFLPADVNLLFASPMKPQSVLLFRLMCQVGVSIFASIYLIFQIPNLVLNLEMSLWSALSIIPAWFFILITGKLLQVFFYTLCSTKSQLKKYLTPVVWGCLILILGASVIYSRQAGLRYLTAATSFFNAPITRWIPVIGWNKGFVLYIYEENYVMAALCFGLLLAGIVLLIWAIWQMKADFYEDAMAKSEETAAIQASIQEGSNISGKKKKVRSEKLRRNALNRGYGANVYLFKSLYNRFRFAPLGIFTKTTITYLGITLASYLMGDVFGFSYSFTFVALAVGGMVFFRALGNPLEEDTKMPLFVLIPENTWMKMFWSMAAGSVNCLLDILPALIVGAILTRTNPVVIPGWTLLILSVDLYASIVSAFMNLSIPQSIGKVAKQLIQILFVYFGLIPDILCVVLGYSFDHEVLGLLGAAAVNLLLATIFFLLTPLFLEPKAGARPRVAPVSEEIRKQASKAFLRIGFAALVLIGTASILQIVIGNTAYARWPELAESSIAMYLLTFLPLDLAAFPAAFLVLRGMKTEAPESQSPGVGGLRFLIYSVMGLYLGNLMGTLVNAFIGLFTTSANSNPIASYAFADNIWMKILFLVIAAPILEELFFRKMLIDRMRPYGEKTAMITSALMFGLFHGNFSQFFYAALLGSIFAYVYLRTGKVRYTIGLHMFINFLGSVLATYLLEQANGNLDALGATGSDSGIGVYVFAIYVVVMIVTAIAGVILLCIRAEKIQFSDVSHELARGQVFKTVWMNVGMILFFLACAVLFTETIWQWM